MADIAFVFHWSPDALWSMPFDEFLIWHEKATERAKLLYKVKF